MFKTKCIFHITRTGLLAYEVTNDYDRENWKQCHKCRQTVPIY
jgi:hypothetical protein